MKAGETARFDCDDCMIEFEVTLEPKAKDSPAAAAHLNPRNVMCCPFCGATSVTSEED